MNILFISSELTPYTSETPLSSMALLSPKTMQKNGNGVRLFMPRFGSINERRHQLHEVIRLSGMNMVINDIDQPLIIKVASIPKQKMQAYFIDNEEYFKRKAIYSDKEGKFFEDNDERMIFFSKGVLETVKKLGWKPDVIHVQGWMSSLVPLYIKEFYKEDDFFNSTKVVLSLFNDKFEGKLSNTLIDKLLFDEFDKSSIELIEDPSYENLIQLAVKHSDITVKGEENINPEVQEVLDSSAVEVKDCSSEENLLKVYEELENQ